MAAPARPLVSVVIVNFNGERYLENLLTSLERQSYPDFEILLVDNASTDGSVPLVERDFPGVRLIRAKGNLGFAEGNNVGIRASRGDFIALINNDTVVEDAWLATLVEDALSSTDIGAVGSSSARTHIFGDVRIRRSFFRRAFTDRKSSRVSGAGGRRRGRPFCFRWRPSGSLVI
jgi:GT2 family glycosyltransferase